MTELMQPLKRPIVGTFIHYSVIKKLKKQKYNFKSYTRLLELAKASVEAGVTLFFFSIKDFDFRQNLIFGTSYDIDSNQWRQDYYPLPDVLFKRGDEGSNKFIIEHIEDILNQHHVIKVNSQSYFDKWEVYRDLSKIDSASKYLPHSVLYQEENDLKNFLKQNNEAYLKGVRGGRGRWIFRIQKKPKGKFEYSYFVNKMVTGQAESWEDLVKEISKFFGERKFIIQKEIKLIKINDSKVDFRAELQRDGEGKLNIIGVSARIGKNQSPITIHSSAYPIEIFLKEVLNYPDLLLKELMAKVHHFLFTIYESLEKVYGTFGEMGIDFGIDQDGEIWFIEPNSKSAKVSLMKAYDQETFHQAFLNPLLFSKYLYMKKSNESDKSSGRMWEYDCDDCGDCCDCCECCDCDDYDGCDDCCDCCDCCDCDGCDDCDDCDDHE
ncbi:YheC/YheD family protein [Pseudogracilibacillus sp. SE30717A]|uniref:YheC/YheD family endospore coat-associated protein n=1 Tax=Pseudogracilibacillus sp. SE30717A TaxID=3098293 RepID=UPI00300E0BBD